MVSGRGLLRDPAPFDEASRGLELRDVLARRGRGATALRPTRLLGTLVGLVRLAQLALRVLADVRRIHQLIELLAVDLPGHSARPLDRYFGLSEDSSNFPRRNVSTML